MEILLILIIVIIFGAVLTGNLGYVLFGMSGFLLLMAALMVVTFFICCLLLLTCKWKEAKFVGLDPPKEGSKYKVAYYLVDGEEIPCLFPEEGVFRERFYQEDKVYHVLLNKKLHRVFDRFAVATCLLGLFGGLLLGVIMISMYY